MTKLQKILFLQIIRNNKKYRELVPKEKSLFYQNDKTGIPIGSLTSQFFALLYLNEMDYFIKRELKVKNYIRYVDDFIIIENDSSNFKFYTEEIDKFLIQNLKMRLHPNKTSIQPSKNGIDFLGYIVRPHRLLIRKRTVSIFKDKLAFFNHILSPIKNNLSVKTDYEFMKLSTMYKDFQKNIDINEHPYVLNMILSTINSYYGIIGFANSYKIRKDLYETHFNDLKKFFIPKNSFRSFSLVEMTRTAGGYRFIM